MQINRLFEIIYLLLDKKRITAGELAKHFEVSSRTIYRDIETLSQAGIPIYASKGIGGGIRLTENFVLNKSVLTETEQKNILSSLHSMSALNVGDVQPVLEKLSALFGREKEDWIEIDFTSWNPDNPVSKRFLLLKQAIYDRAVVTFHYSGLTGNTSPRRAEPLKLVFRGNQWYLLAWCQLREDFRFFKLTRMDSLLATKEHFIRRNSIVPNPPREVTTPTMIQITATADASLLYRLRDEFDSNQLMLQPDGRICIDFEMPDNEWLYDYLMTYIPHMKILKPKSVNEKLLYRLKKGVEEYEI